MTVSGTTSGVSYLRGSRRRRALGSAVVLVLVGSALAPFGDLQFVEPAFADTPSVGYTFDVSGDLESSFDVFHSTDTPTSVGRFFNSTSGGINNTGAIALDETKNTYGILTTKTTASMGGVGSTYVFSIYGQSKGSPGYSGMGFTSATALSGTKSFEGSIYRPSDALGISVHGSGFTFHNGATRYAGYWKSNEAGTTTDPGISPDRVNSACLYFINSVHDDGNASCAAEDGWYKLQLTLVRVANVDSKPAFDLKIEVWPTDSTGLVTGDPHSMFQLKNVVNETIGNASKLHSYISVSGKRFRYLDGFSVELSGGAELRDVPAVVTTDSATLSERTVVLEGNVSSEGSESVTERGFVYSTSTNPTTANTKIVADSGAGAFSATTASLDPGVYYFRAFATNSIGTSYGTEFSRTINATLTFDANADQHQRGVVAGSPPATVSAAPGTVTLPGPGTLSRTGFTFAGWSTSPTGSSPKLEGADFALTDDTTLYAVWEIPEAARLFGLGDEQKITLSGGNIRGLTTDGDSIFYVSSTDTTPIIRRVDFAGVAQPSITVTGTGAAGVLAAVREGQRDLAYSAGHIFVRENGFAGSKLYAISVATGALVEVPLPESRPLFEGQAWLKGNLIDFPDGRIGAVSKNRQDLTGTGLTCPEVSFQCKVLRLYNIDVSGGVITATFSEDILIADDDARVSASPSVHCWVGSSYTVAGGSYDGWPCDDHGIATDGTYLYQSHHSRGYKTWGLKSGGNPSFVVFNGDGSKLVKAEEASCGAPTGVSGGLCPISGPYASGNPAGFTLANATYFTRDHKGNRYIMGDFDAAALLITQAATPPAGPGTEKSVSPPRSVVASPGDAQVVVSWDEPAIGTPIVGYTVTANPGGAMCSTLTTTRSCTVTGLTNGTSYTFSVVALNDTGESASATSLPAVPMAGAGDDDDLPPENTDQNQNQNQNQNRNQNNNRNQNSDNRQTVPPSGGLTPSVPPGRTQPVQPPGQNPVLPAPPALTGPLVNQVSTQQGETINRTFVAGKQVEAQFVQQGDRAVTVKTGGFEVGVQVARSGSTNRLVSNQQSDSVALQVSPGETLAISANRLLPGSVVQVWMRGVNGQPEVGRAIVDPTGRINSQMLFPAGEAGRDLAVGPHVMQVTGTDANGNTVAVELVVNIPQGAVSPERYREVNQLPQLKTGEVTGTSAGKRIALRFSAEPNQSRLRMSAEDWVFTLDLSQSPTQGVSNGPTPTVTLSQSGSASLTGQGLMPGTTMSVWLFSEPTLVATNVVDDSGVFTVDFVVDKAFIDAGEHTLQIQGVGTDGFIKAANLGVTVDASDPGLIITPVLWVAASLLLLLLLLALFGFFVRRSHHHAGRF